MRVLSATRGLRDAVKVDISRHADGLGWLSCQTDRSVPSYSPLFISRRCSPEAGGGATIFAKGVAGPSGLSLNAAARSP